MTVLDGQRYVQYVRDLMNRSLFADVTDSHEQLFLMGLVMGLLDNPDGYAVSTVESMALQRAYAYLFLIKKKVRT